MLRADHLDVYFGAELVGWVHDSAPLAFEYSAAWLLRADPLPIAAIALQGGRNDSAMVQAFFENLLPEGDLRDYVGRQKQASTLFALLFEIGGDTAGGFVILPPGKTPGRATYEATSWADLAARLNKGSASAIDIKGRGARISLAGAQDKTSLAIFDDGVPRLPRASSPSTHILKPDIKRLPKVWHSAANETITMLTAAYCGLPTAEVFYEPHTQSCIVRRFDRFTRADGTLGRFVQYDMCQLAGTVSAGKYEAEGGPGIAACAGLIRQYSTQPAIDLRNFVTWIIFNLYVGNNDSHAKNLSIFRVPGFGVALAPFYDLMCTRLYPGLSRRFAFAIGGENRPGSVDAQHMVLMAQQLGMRAPFVAGLAAELAGKMPDATAHAVAAVVSSLPPGAVALAHRLRSFVLANTRKMAARIVS